MRETDTPCEPELQACALLVRSNVSHAVDGDILVEESDSDALRHINSTLSLTDCGKPFGIHYPVRTYPIGRVAFFSFPIFAHYTAIT